MAPQILNDPYIYNILIDTSLFVGNHSTKHVFNSIKGSTPSDPFWEHALGLMLQSLIHYVKAEYPKTGKKATFRALMDLLLLAKVSEKDGEQSELDKLMFALPESHPARVAYEKFKSGAKDTMRSNRKNTIVRLEEILPEVKDDPDMEAIVVSVTEKLKLISDEVYKQLGLEEYREELLAEDEEVESNEHREKTVCSVSPEARPGSDGSTSLPFLELYSEIQYQSHI